MRKSGTQLKEAPEKGWKDGKDFDKEEVHVPGEGNRKGKWCQSVA